VELHLKTSKHVRSPCLRSSNIYVAESDGDSHNLIAGSKDALRKPKLYSSHENGGVEEATGEARVVATSTTHACTCKTGLAQARREVLDVGGTSLICLSLQSALGKLWPSCETRVPYSQMVHHIRCLTFNPSMIILIRGKIVVSNTCPNAFMSFLMIITITTFL
jgi:hypothetical protein